jgi:hypothetical protein
VRRVGGVTALTLAGVLVAAGAAAALNSRVLLGGVSSPVGTAESFLPAEEPPAPALTTPAGGGSRPCGGTGLGRHVCQGHGGVPTGTGVERGVERRPRRR